MNYLRVPTKVTLHEIRSRDSSWSPSMFRQVIIPTANVKPVRELLSPSMAFDKGVEPGSMHYLRKSTHYFIRTKALQDHSYLIYPKGDAIIPISPRVFEDPGLVDGDILISKDSNVGECAMVDGNRWRNHMFSGGIVRLNPSIDRFYFFAFLKHPLFKTQLLAMSPRGATIRHAKTLWLNCLIPFPNQRDADRVICYVSALMQAIVEKEKTIRDKSSSINSLIDSELRSHQISVKFQFRLPLISEVSSAGRLDSAIYAERYKSTIWLIHNYANGFETPRTAGFSIIPGPSLEIKILHTRIDSDTWRKGYYLLIIPTNISEYGTISREQFLGTAKPLPELRKGDIIFGESGSHRSIVFLGLPYNSPITTNAHGLYARRFDNNVSKSIFFRCIYDWLYKNQVIDLLAVGGSGGHFSPAYFEALPIPKFPSDKDSEIVRLYHNPAPPPPGTPNLETFVDWHRRWNTDLGIWELDREMKVLQKVLLKVQDQIIEGKTINLPF